MVILYVKNKKIVYLSLLISVAIVLHIVEGMIPLLQIFILPGVKLGLANIITLISLLLFGFKESMFVLISRSILSSLLIGTFLTIPFFLGLAGAIASGIIMGFVYILANNKVNLITISILGAISHNISQLLTASYIVKQIAVFTYLPYMLLLSIPTGIFIGTISKYIIKNKLFNLNFQKAMR